MLHESDTDAAVCAHFLAADAVVDPQAAYARFAARPAAPRRRVPIGLAFAVVPLIAIVLLATTPLGSYARSVLTIFEPQTFTAVDVASLGRDALRHLDDYGSFRRGIEQPMHRVPNVTVASRFAGFDVRVPTHVPAGFVPDGTRVQGSYTDTFTFQARKARAAALRAGRPTPTFPKTIDGTTVYATFHPFVMQSWRDPGDRGASFVVAETTMPSVRSTGPSMRDLEAFLTAQPGVPREVAEQLRAIGDPSATLPVPFRSDRQHAVRTLIEGVPAIAIGDDTGVGAGVLWQKAGRVFAVYGRMRLDEATAVARSIR